MTLPLQIRPSIPLRITLAVLGLMLLGVWGLTFYASHLLQQDLHAALGEHQDALVLVRQRIVLAAAVVTLGLSALVWWVVRRQLSPLLNTLGQHNSALEQLRIAATAFESLEGKTITNAEQVILKVNAAFTRITGYSAEEVVGQTPRMLSSGRQSPSFYKAMWHTLVQDGFWQGDIWNRRKSGEIYPVWMIISAVKDETGSATHYVATFSDISAHKTSEARIQNLSYYDPLTGLPNRALMMDRTAQAQTAITRNQSEGALLLIDLDHFKTLNETLGHEIGDLLLQQVAQRLNTCVREGDTVARLGADEFMVLLEDLGKNTPEAATRARLVGEKIRTLFDEPYVLGEHSCHITPSIGLSLFSDGHPGIDELLKRTDLAMSQAKDAGGNSVRFFDPK